jgi:hypothetical protein
MRIFLLVAAAAAISTAGSLAFLGIPPFAFPATKSENLSRPPVPRATIAIAGKMIAHGDWFDGIGDGFWRDFREKPYRAGEPPFTRRKAFRTVPRDGADYQFMLDRDEESVAHPAEPPTALRTVCVRLCDGYYWPISYATGSDRLAHDARQCEKSCPSRARLFLHRNPGQGVDDMADLDGRPYRKLPTAYLYRTQYIADCTCRGHPWEEQSLARHRAYAEAVKSKTGSKAR